MKCASARGDSSETRTKRRRIIQVIGLGAVGISGCLGGGSGDGGGSQNNGSDDGGGSQNDGSGDGGGSSDEGNGASNGGNRGKDGGSNDGGDGMSDSGDGSDGGENSNNGSNESDMQQSGDPSFCSVLTDSGYKRYDEKGSSFVATFEYPRGQGSNEGVLATATANNELSLTIRKNPKERQPFDMFPTQDLKGTDSLTPAEMGEVKGLEKFGELEYNGETLPLVKSSGGPNADSGADRYTKYPYYVVGLPHKGSSGKKYYRFDLRATVQFADDLEPTVCVGTWDKVAKHLLKSLKPNTDTTIESA